MISESYDRGEAPFATAVSVFRIALTTFAREVAKGDFELAAKAMATAEAVAHARLGDAEGGTELQDVVGYDAAVRNAVRYQLTKVLTAARAAIEAAKQEQLDAGG